MYKGSGGTGNYAELSQIRHRDNGDNYFQVFNDDFVDWDNPYDIRQTDSNLDIDCIKSKMQSAVPGKVEVSEPIGTVQEPFNDEKFWYNDPTELIRKDRICVFIPQPNMSKNAYLNAIARLGIYASILIALLYNNHKYLLIIALVLLLTIFLHNNYVTQERVIQGGVSEGMSSSYSCPAGKVYGSAWEQYPKCGQNQPNLHPYSQAYPDSLKKKGLIKDYITKKGDIMVPVNTDKVCSIRYLNPTTGMYNWIRQSDHADFRGNSRLVNNKTDNNTMMKLMTDLNDAYGKEIAARNSYIPVHARDVVNTNMPEFLYGKNLDRRMYSSRS